VLYDYALTIQAKVTTVTARDFQTLGLIEQL